MTKRGRPRKRILYEVKPEIAECVLCYHSYDLNTTLPEQRMINDNKFCKNCFYEFLIMNYETNNVKSFL